MPKTFLALIPYTYASLEAAILYLTHICKL